MQNKTKIYNICFCAIMVALGVVLSFIKLWQMPLGGSITLCNMLPIIFIGYFFGPKWGLISSFVFALIILLLNIGTVMAWGVSAIVLISCFFLDYIFPYTLLGLSGVFLMRKKTKQSQNPFRFSTFFAGMSLVVFLRFLCHWVSGIALFSQWALFQPVWLYSICYNAAFLLPDFLLCAIAGAILFRPMKKIIRAQ